MNKIVYKLFDVNESCRVGKELGRSKVCVVTKYNQSFAAETNNTNAMAGTT